MSQPTPAATNSKPIQMRSPTEGCSKAMLRRTAIIGARTKRVVMRAAVMRGINQNRMSSAGRGRSADQKDCVRNAVRLSGLPWMSGPAMRRAAAADVAIAANGAMAASGWVARARRTAKQLAAARLSAAKSNPAMAAAEGMELGSCSGKMQSVPATAARAPMRPAMVEGLASLSRCGERTTARTGTSEKIATRVVAETHEAESETSAAGTAKRPKPTAIALHN